MKLSLAEPKYLKESISIISELVNEARFKITPEAIELVAMDPANVAMVIYKLLASNFTEYDVKKDTDIAINLGNLKQILRRAGPNDMVTLEVTPESKLQVTLRGTSKRTFSIPIIDIEEKEQKIPELNFDVEINAECGLLNNAIEDVDIVAESVSFVAEDKKFTILAEGDLSKAKIEIAGDDKTKIAAKTKDVTKAKYSIEYLKKMVAGAKLADTVGVYFSKDYPLKLEYKAIDKVLLQFILAPRVEND